MYLVASVRLSVHLSVSVCSTFWRAAVDIRGSALSRATKSKEESSSVEGVCLCVCLKQSHFCFYLLKIWLPPVPPVPPVPPAFTDTLY